MPNYKVKQGECISSIAYEHGHFWEKLWNHSDNAKLKEKRKDPNVLYPGDVVCIPDIELRKEPCDTEQKYRFIKKGTPAKFCLIVERDDKPMKNTDYIFTTDGVNISGKTDEKGFLEVQIKPNAKHGKLIIADLTYELEFGSMDPIEENTGIQVRLQNLGFYHGALDGIIGPRTQQAIKEFQAFSDLNPTGTMDDQTRDKLFNRHDKEHEAPPDESYQEEPPMQIAGDTMEEPDDISDSIEVEDDYGDSGVDESTQEDIHVPESESDR